MGAIERDSKHQYGTPARHDGTSNVFARATKVVLTLLAIAVLSARLVSTLHIGRATSPARYVFVFGDSYSSVGYNMSLQPQPSLVNPFGNAPYAGARTSGGDIWIDTVVQNLTNTIVYDLAVGANMVNYTQCQATTLAAGGPVKDFRDQEAEFALLAKNKTIGRTSQNSVFISWFGINDVAVQIYQSRNFSTSTAILAPDVDQYYTLMTRQYLLGARNFIIVLVPPIYRAPVYSYGAGDNALALQNLTLWWNALVTQKSQQFLKRCRQAKALVVDPSPTFNNMLDNPSAYGASNSTCLSYPQGQPCLWADFIHPGLVMQREWGNRMVTAISSWK